MIRRDRDADVVLCAPVAPIRRQLGLQERLSVDGCLSRCSGSTFSKGGGASARIAGDVRTIIAEVGNQCFVVLVKTSRREYAFTTIRILLGVGQWVRFAPRTKVCCRRE